MDLKKIFAGGEPRISNPDLMYTQYSNYYAIHGIERGLNIDGNGVVVDGCEVSATYNQVDEVITISLTDGYLGIGDRLVKAEQVADIVNFDVTFTNPTAVVYVYGETDVTYNPLGDKTFNDASVRQTWEQSRVSIFANQTGAPVAGAVIIAYIVITRSTGAITFTNVAKNIGQQIIVGNELTNVTTANRNTKNDKVVTGDVLYDVMGNWSMQVLTSVSSAVINDTKQFNFNLPSDAVGVFLIGAQTFISGTDIYIGNASTPDLSYQMYAYDYSLKTLQVYFSQVGITLSSTAQAMVMVNRVNQY